MTKQREPSPEQLKRQREAMKKFFGLKPLTLPKKPEPPKMALALVLAMIAAPVAADALWMPLGNSYVNAETGDVAMPLGGRSHSYVMPDNRLLMRQRGGAIDTNGTAYVGGRGLYAGTDGTTGYVARNGDIYEFDAPQRNRHREVDEFTIFEGADQP